MRRFVGNAGTKPFIFFCNLDLSRLVIETLLGKGE